MSLPSRIAAAVARWPGERSLETRLALLLDATDGRIVLTTSFGLEDQALTHAAAALGAEIDIVTLDTGRLFPETLDVWAETEARYGRIIPAYAPDAAAAEALARRQGAQGHRQSVAARQACCHVRKVEPLARALAGADVWIAGLRADQSAHRGALAPLTYEADLGVTKVLPLFDWSRERTEAYALARRIPLNALHARGFASIGCAPCTRAIAPGESERAGRWWWEASGKTECGLHARPASANAQELQPQ